MPKKQTAVILDFEREEEEVPLSRQPLVIAPGLKELPRLLAANCSLISIDSHNCEVDYVLEQICHLAYKKKFQVYSWRLNEKPERLEFSEETGLVPQLIEANIPNAMPQQEIIAALTWIASFNPNEKAVFVVHNIQSLLHSTMSSDLKLKDKLLSLANRWNAGEQPKRLILLGQGINPLPNDFLGLAEEMSVDLPTYEQVKETVLWNINYTRQWLLTCKEPLTLKNKLNAQKMETLFRSFQAFTLYEIARMIRIGVRKFKVPNKRLIQIDEQFIQYVNERKREKLSRLGIEVESPPEVPIVGLQVWSEWLTDELRLLESSARQKYNTPHAKGAILLGPPGTGKTSAAAAIAAQWGIPAFKFSWDAILEKYVGDPEKNLRRFLKTIESISPCVLILDEFDKAFSGINNDVNTVMKRLYSTFLTWLAGKTSPVLVVATANSLDGLDLALTRKGRFDEIFYMGLPTLDERIAILGVHLKNLRIKVDDSAIQATAIACEGWVGAELAALAIQVQRRLLLQLPDLESGPENLDASEDLLIKCTQRIRPMIEVPANRQLFEDMQRWGQQYAVNASVTPQEPIPLKTRIGMGDDDFDVD